MDARTCADSHSLRQPSLAHLPEGGAPEAGGVEKRPVSKINHKTPTKGGNHLTNETKEALLERLRRKLRLDEPDEELLTLLEDELLDAEAELKLELNVDELDEDFHAKLVALSVLYYKQDLCTEDLVRSWTCTEGQVSESQTKESLESLQKAERELLHSVRRYRRVSC